MMPPRAGNEPNQITIKPLRSFPCISANSSGDPFMRRFRRTLLAGAIALAVAAPASAQFTGAFFFGDSLVDAGSYKPVVGGTALFTTNPGPIWAQTFAQNFGFTATPANQGGNDYAYGGARVTQTP